MDGKIFLDVATRAKGKYADHSLPRRPFALEEKRFMKLENFSYSKLPEIDLEKERLSLPGQARREKFNLQRISAIEMLAAQTGTKAMRTTEFAAYVRRLIPKRWFQSRSVEFIFLQSYSGHLPDEAVKKCAEIRRKKLAYFFVVARPYYGAGAYSTGYLDPVLAAVFPTDMRGAEYISECQLNEANVDCWYGIPNNRCSGFLFVPICSWE